MREIRSVRVIRGGSGRALRTLALLVGVLAGLLGARTSSAAEVEFQFEASLVPGTCGLDCLGALGGTLVGEWLFESTASGSGANPSVYPLISIDFDKFSNAKE